jgi:hypothetical protein
LTSPLEALARMSADASRPFDLVIANGHLIDGTGLPWNVADIGIRGGRIAASGNLTAASAASTRNRQLPTVHIPELPDGFEPFIDSGIQEDDAGQRRGKPKGDAGDGAELEARPSTVAG